MNDKTQENPEDLNAVETMDLALGPVSDKDPAHKSHNASSPTLHNSNLQDIIPKRRKQNKLIPRLTEQEQAGFWARVAIGSEDQCWPWTGARCNSAYSPEIFYGNWRGYKVHRIAFTLHYGPIPENLTVDHVRSRGCTDTLCCNWRHLEAITQTEQVVRRDAGKLVAPGMTLCKWGHVRPMGRTAHCVECNRMHAKRFRERHPEKIANYPSRQPKTVKEPQ